MESQRACNDRLARLCRNGKIKPRQYWSRRDSNIPCLDSNVHCLDSTVPCLDSTGAAETVLFHA